MPRHRDTSLLEAALIGFQHMRDNIQEAIADVRQRLKAPPTPPLLPALKAPARRKRRKMSAAARRRISVASKKRWAKYRRQQKGK